MYIPESVLVIGASGGLGTAVTKQLLDMGVPHIFTTYNKNPVTEPGVFSIQCDTTNSQDLDNLSQTLSSEIHHIDWVINCTGVLHTSEYMPEKTIQSVNKEQINHNFAINAVSHLLLLKRLKKLIFNAKRAQVVSFSARIGSIEDNQLGGWYAYRMSKAALNMGMKTLHIEWRRFKPQMRFILFHPGTTDTALSKPFQKRVPHDKLFSPDWVATQLLTQMQSPQNQHWGTISYIDYQGKNIQW